VKSRSRSPGTETSSLRVPRADLERVDLACGAFGCAPYCAFVIDAADVLTVLKRERKPREQQTQAPVDEHLDEILPPELAQLEDTALRPDVIIEEPPQSDSPHANGNGDATP